MPHLSVIIYSVHNIWNLFCDYIFPIDKLSQEICNMQIDDFATLSAEKTIREGFITRLHLFHFDNTYIARLIHMIKYEKNTTAIQVAGALLAEKITTASFHLERPTIICPIPQSKLRKNERGYNQCALLTKQIHEHIPSLIYKPNLLRKIKHTRSQTKHTRKQRLENIANSIAVTQGTDIEHSSVIVIDDVYTTGATATEAIRALQLYNPNHIYFITLAWA